MAGLRYEKQIAENPLRPLDPRWLDAAALAGSLELVCHLARPGNAACNRFLAEQLKVGKQAFELHLVLSTMVRVEHPAQPVRSSMHSRSRPRQALITTTCRGSCALIEQLPRSAFPLFEALLTKLPDKMVDQLMDSVLVLKNKLE